MKVKIVETQLEVVSAELIAAHPELHHYTNRAGLEGILASETLWATHFEDLNDATEVTHLRAPLTEALAARMIRRLAERRNESMSHRRRIDAAGGVYRTATGLARDLISALYKTTFQDDGGAPLGVPFITSFCSHSDDQCYERKNGLLSQWRGYGGVGGYCLVFDTDKLGAALSCEFGQHHYVHINLVAA